MKLLLRPWFLTALVCGAWLMNIALFVLAIFTPQRAPEDDVPPSAQGTHHTTSLPDGSSLDLSATSVTVNFRCPHPP